MARRGVSTHFVGRASEIARLRDAFASACTGSTNTVLVGGEAGVGKSRLLEEFATWAREAGALVLTGGCVELDGEAVPYAPIVAARRASLDMSADEFRALLDGYDRELARLFPELGPPPAAAFEDEFSRARLYEAVLGVLRRLGAGRPVVLAVEDLHWADRSTRDLFGFVARSLRDTRVLLVATYRSDDLHRGHPVRGFLAELDRIPSVERLELPRFTRAEVGQQLQSILGAAVEPSLVTEVYQRAEGNAFFTEELAITMRDSDGPVLSDSLRDLLLVRIDKLPEQSRRVLRILAAGGSCVAHDLLATVTGMTDETLTEAIRPAVDAHVLTPDRCGTSYCFRHALMREAVRGELLPGERRRLHVRYAEALETLPEDEDRAWWLAQIAHHWYAAHDNQRALPAAIKAAQAASERYAFAEELRLLERAIELWDSAPHPTEDPYNPGEPPAYLHLLYHATRAAARGGDADRALALANQALTEVDEEQDPILTSILLRERGGSMRTLGRGDGTDDLRRAVELLAAPSYAMERSHAMVFLAAGLNLNGDVDEALAVCNVALPLAREVGSQYDEIHALTTSGGLLAALGHAEEGIARMHEAAARAEAYDDPALLARAKINLSSSLEGLDRYTEAVEVARTALPVADQSGRTRIQGAMLRNNLAEPLVALGRWAEAMQVLDEGLELDPPGVHSVDLLRQRAGIAVARGRWEDARAYLERAHRIGGRTTIEPQYRVPLAIVEAEFAAWQGNVATVRAVLREVLSRWVRPSAEQWLWPLLAIAARAEADAAELGRSMRAEPDGETAVAEIQEFAEVLSSHVPSWPVYAMIIEAELDRAAGDDSSAAWRRAAHRARAVGEALPRHVHAYLLYRTAESSAATGCRDTAAVCAREAFAIAHGLDAEPLLREIELLAHRARLPLDTDMPHPDTPAAEEPGERLGLTPRELDVLRLLCDGLSNRQIGERLFISTKTASVHVSNIIAKLGVANRGEAAAVAHRLRLFEETAAG